MRQTIRLAVLCLAAAASLGAAAQGPRGKRFSPEEFKARLEAEVTRQSRLTAEEAQRFFPLYREMRERQRDMNRRAHDLKRRPAAQLSEKECAAAVQQIKKLGVDMAELEENYYKRLCKAVPAQKVLAAMQAEDEFHRRMLSEFNHGRGDAPRGGGDRRGKGKPRDE